MRCGESPLPGPIAVTISSSITVPVGRSRAAARLLRRTWRFSCSIVVRRFSFRPRASSA